MLIPSIYIALIVLLPCSNINLNENGGGGCKSTASKGENIYFILLACTPAPLSEITYFDSPTMVRHIYFTFLLPPGQPSPMLCSVYLLQVHPLPLVNAPATTALYYCIA